MVGVVGHFSMAQTNHKFPHYCVLGIISPPKLLALLVHYFIFHSYMHGDYFYTCTCVEIIFILFFHSYMPGDYFVCRIVKLTSPNLNYFIISGAVLLYGSVYVRVYFDSSELYNDVRCNVSNMYIQSYSTSILSGADPETRGWGGGSQNRKTA